MIELWNVNKTYETGNKALRNINITVEDGEFVFIIGRSGSGKSTLLKLLLKEVEPTSGDVYKRQGYIRKRKPIFCITWYLMFVKTNRKYH